MQDHYVARVSYPIVGAQTAVAKKSRDRLARHHRRVAAGAADFRRTRAEAVRPGREPAGPLQVQTDDESLDYARRNGSTCYYASCTCLTRSQAMAVVDDELKVHGLDGLRVIDDSVMPAVTSTSANAPTIMIAEKGAAMIKGAVRQRRAA